MKKILNKIFNRGSIGSSDKHFVDWFHATTGDNVDGFQEVTYLTCIKVISEIIGKLPINLYDGDTPVNNHISRLLSQQPNPYTNAYSFWLSVEVNRLHHGNAYVYIRRTPDGNPHDLWIMPSTSVQVIVDDAGLFGTSNNLYYQFVDPQTGEIHVFHSDDVIHLRDGVSQDGINGSAVRDNLANLIRGNHDGQKFLSNLWQGGMSAKAVLQYTGDLDEPTKKRLVDGVHKFATDAKNAATIIPIPVGMQLTPLNLKLTENQFLELRQLNSLQIAAAFNVKPTMINDYGEFNYSTSEIAALEQKNALMSTFKQYELEIGNKLLLTSDIENGLHIKVDYSEMLSVDKKTEAESLGILVDRQIITTEEARQKLNMSTNGGENDD